jgi:hypothetical protein
MSSKKAYYLEVTITGKAKVWVTSDELKTDKELNKMDRDEVKKFYESCEWDSDELVEWDVNEITKIERSEEMDQ